MRSMKEDFILIYLQPTCKHCRCAIVSGTRWVCTSCKNFLLCDQYARTLKLVQMYCDIMVVVGCALVLKD